MANKKFKSSQELLDAYSNGLVGAYCDPEAMERFLASLDEPYFSTAGLQLFGSGEGKLSTPYKSIYRVYTEMPPFTEKQVTGDCVSHGGRNTADVSRAVQIDVGRTLESYVGHGATEAIYGDRGHGGQGMSCEGASEWLKNKGGVLVRAKYGQYDLSVYNGNLGAGWGGRSGTPKELTEIASQHPVRTVTLIRSLEEARDALANGYAINVCSNQGFSSTRDEKGYAKPQGSWSHSMSWIGCDDSGSEIGFLIQNSWGAWNAGGHPEWGPIPDGSFLIHADVAERMIKAGSSFAYSSIVGFPPTELPCYGSSEYL